MVSSIQCLSVKESNKGIHWIALPNFCKKKKKKEKTLHRCLLV